MHETDDSPVPERSDEQHTTAKPRPADPRLRTFRTGSDLPFLVLSDERRDDPSPTRDRDAGT
jgi:hypothetical protein